MARVAKKPITSKSKRGPKAPVVKVQPEEPPPLIGVREAKDGHYDRMPTHQAVQFPRELRCRRMDDEGEDAYIEVELFGHKRRVFGAAELHFPAEENGGDVQVHYELIDEHHRSGLIFKVYRKIDTRRRIAESTGELIGYS